MRWTCFALVWLGAASLHAAELFSFEDVSKSSGLDAVFESAAGKRPWRYGHGAAWGDVDGDGRPDLYAGAFAGRKYFQGDDAPIPARLLWNRDKGFIAADEATIELRDNKARCSGAVMADLDGDGDLDLVVSTHVQVAGQGKSRLFENKQGKFVDVTPAEAPWSLPLGVRNIGVLDADRDGRLDLLVADGSYGKAQTANARLWLLAGRGGFRFEDISAKAGLPQDKTSGLGLAIADANDDGWPDIFVAGSNRLFLSDGNGRYVEANPGKLAVPTADKEEGLHCGAAFGDLDGDGRLELVTSEHGVPARLHIFQNQAKPGESPNWTEVSESTKIGGLLPRGTRQLPIKTAHISLCDMDSDGLLDIVTTVLHETDRGLQPVVLRNQTKRGGPIEFAPWPEKLVTYYAPGPIADYDRDGRPDLFLPSWFEEVPNRLYRNTTSGGHWLAVRVSGSKAPFNGMGLNATIRAYAAGHLGEPDHLLGRRDLSLGNGYASGEEAIAYFGLGKIERCDLRIDWNGKTIERKDVKGNQYLGVDIGQTN